MKRLHTSMKCIVGILLVVLMVVPNGLKAETTEVFQASKVTGVVLDELGEPVIGVTVRVKNDKRNGTITNADGRYVISVSKKCDIDILLYRLQDTGGRSEGQKYGQRDIVGGQPDAGRNSSHWLWQCEKKKT